jgi:ketosteroid isomerase-like protein
MPEEEIRQVAEAFWTSLAAGDWDAAARYIHPDFVQEWPQSGERIVGAENALAIDRNFPGGMPSMQLRRVRSAGDLATTEVSLTYADGSTYLGVSLLEFRDGRIARETDYFAEPFPAPQWRAQWVERM